MKKSLLALAVLGAFATAAQAQTNVTIGGVVYANVKSYSIGSTVRNTSNEMRVDDDFDSRFWLTGSEDLGGGNSAIFYMENRLNSDVNNVQGTANGLSNGDTWVGLKGSWGQVTLGKHTLIGTQGLTSEWVNTAGGAGLAAFAATPSSGNATVSILDQFGGGYIDGASRTNNSIKYTSPNMGGFVGVVAVSTNATGNEGNLACTGSGLTALTSVVPAAGSTTQTATCPQLTVAGNGAYSDGRLYFLQGNYNNGPISATLGYRNQNVEGRIGTDDRQLRFSGAYTLPMGLKVGLQLDRVNRTSTAAGATTASRTAWSLPVGFQMGQGMILGSYTRAGDYNGVANTGAKMFTLGYDYALSKRTNVGVMYSKLSNDTGAAYQPFLAGTSFTGSGLAAGESATTIGLGVKHVF